MPKKFEIRNSTAEFLIFQIEGKEQGIEVYYKDKTVWCTQKAKEMNPRILQQTYDNTCEIKLSIRQSEAEKLRQRLSKLSFE